MILLWDIETKEFFISGFNKSYINSFIEIIVY